jgi:hypothetical protein
MQGHKPPANAQGSCLQRKYELGRILDMTENINAVYISVIEVVETEP